MNIFGVKNKAIDILIKLASIILAVCLLVAFGVLIINAAMIDATDDMIFEVSELGGESVDCVVILGAGLKADGTPNHMLEDRLKVGIEVAKAVGAKYILMSGDDSGIYYNEPAAMKKYAMEQGVPESQILLDGQGFSTYESITRLSDVYGFDSVVIITQEYHLYRAMYMIKRMGAEADGFGTDYREYFLQIKRDIREYFARCKDFIKVNTSLQK